MYMALTEKQAQEIRKLGIFVIEWKRCIRNNVKVGIYVINKIADKAAKAMKVLAEVVSDFIDRVALVVEEINEKIHNPVSRRYKFVKILGAMGYDKQRIWILTHHTWLARSNC